MAYKSPRLLLEAINKQIDSMKEVPDLQNDIQWAELKQLIDELGKMTDRPSIDDLRQLSPVDYVTAMKPLVQTFHRQLMVTDLLADSICQDLDANGVVLLLIGNSKTLVRAAVHPQKPETQLVVDTVIQVLDVGMKNVADEATALADEVTKNQENPAEESWHKRIRYVGAIERQDSDRNVHAEFVVVDNTVVKDRFGETPRPATEEEIDGCVLIADPATGVGCCDRIDADHKDGLPCGAPDCYLGRVQ